MAYCAQCGTLEVEGQKFCGVCGAPTSGSTSIAPMPPLTSTEMRGEAGVRVGIALEPPLQVRWTILIRLILTLPLLVAAFFVGVAAFFATIASWFASLFLGRVPDGLQTFVTGNVRLYANVLAYAFLLTSRWPGLVFEEGAHDQVSLAIDHVSLNRAAVFFRVVLAIPGSLVSVVLSLGSYPFLIVMWVWGLLSGRETEALHQALALVLRYQIRFQAYAYLLTPTQPFRGLVGDGDASVAMSTPNTSDSALPATSSLPTTWLIAKNARTVLVIIIVVGLVLYVFQRGVR
jgi:hypothetical protein